MARDQVEEMRRTKHASDVLKRVSASRHHPTISAELPSRAGDQPAPRACADHNAFRTIGDLREFHRAGIDHYMPHTCDAVPALLSEWLTFPGYPMPGSTLC